LAHIAIASGFQMHTHSNKIDDLKMVLERMPGLVPHLTRQFQARMAQNQRTQQTRQAQR